MRGLLGLMSGLAQGYGDEKDRQYDRARQARMDQLVLDRAARDAAEFERTQRYQGALDAAGAPVAPAPDMATMADGTVTQRSVLPPSMDNRDVGLPGEQAMLPAQRVGMEGMLNPDQARAAAAQANAPEAVQGRQLGVVRQFDPARATQMEASMLTLKHAKGADLDKEFEKGLNDAAAKGWDGLMDYTNKSGASPAQHRFVPSTDGKTGEVVAVAPDGSMKPTGMKFENSQKGVLEAAQLLSKSTPIDAKLKHIAAEREAARKEAHDQALDDYHQKYLEVLMDKNTVSANKAEAGGKSMVERMSEADKATYADINKQREKLSENITKAKIDNLWDPKAENHRAVEASLAALNAKARALESKYSDGSVGGADPLNVRGKPSSNGTPGTPAREQMKVPPGMQAARDKDRARILADELAVETDPDARAAIQREILRLPTAERVRTQAMTDAKDGGRGTPVVKSASVPAVKAPSMMEISPTQIPAPPPEMTMENVRTPAGMMTKRIPNPAFIAWKSTYGPALEEKQRQEEAAVAAATSAARSQWRPEGAPYMARR